MIDPLMTYPDLKKKSWFWYSENENLGNPRLQESPSSRCPTRTPWPLPLSLGECPARIDGRMFFYIFSVCHQYLQFLFWNYRGSLNYLWNYRVVSKLPNFFGMKQCKCIYGHFEGFALIVHCLGWCHAMAPEEKGPFSQNLGNGKTVALLFPGNSSRRDTLFRFHGWE